MAASVRGKVGGSTFRNVNGSTIITTNSNSLAGKIGLPFEQTLSVTSAYSRNYRAAFAYFARAWQSLTPEQRDAWRHTPINGRYGRDGFLSANLSATSGFLGNSIIPLPLPISPAIPTGVKILRPTPGNIYVTHSDPGSNPTTDQIAYISPPFMPSVTSHRNRLKFVRAVYIRNEIFTLTPYIQFLYGTLRENSRYFITLVAVARRRGSKQVFYESSFIPSELPQS